MKALIPATLTLMTTTTALAMPPERMEYHVGLSAGQASYQTTPFALEGRGSPEAAAAIAPFQAGPFAGVTYGGIDVGTAIVVRSVRLSAAHRWDVPQFDMSATTALPDGGVASARGLNLSTWRIGLGGEIPTDDDFPTVFAELVGQYQRVQADLALPDGPARYTGTAFGYGLQGGVQVPITEASHVMVSGEYGVYGQPTWSAMVGIGMHFG